MISGVIYLYAFILSSIGSFFDFLLPFPVPDSLLSVTDIINSFWYYGLILLPISTITLAKFFFFAFTFYIVLKVVSLVRLPFTWVENHLGGSPSAPGRSSFGDVHSRISSKRK